MYKRLDPPPTLPLGVYVILEDPHALWFSARHGSSLAHGATNVSLPALLDAHPPFLTNHGDDVRNEKKYLYSK